MKYKVIKRFKDLEDNKRLYEIGQSYPREGLEPTEERAQYIANKGFIELVEEEGKKDEQQDENTEVFPQSTGGGWYLLSNGEKIQGKEEAIAAEEALKSGE